MKSTNGSGDVTGRVEGLLTLNPARKLVRDPSDVAPRDSGRPNYRRTQTPGDGAALEMLPDQPDSIF